MPRAHDRLCPHRGRPRFERSPALSSSYRNRLARIPPPPGEAPAPGAEDFTTYSLFDPNNVYTVTPNVITGSAVDRDQTARVYADKGVHHFGAAWEHKLKTTCDHTGGKTDTWALVGVWSISDTILDMRQWDLADDNAISLYWYHSAVTLRFTLHDWKTDSKQYRSYGSGASVFTAYPIIQRLTETDVQCRIYTDAERLNLLDTLNITITSGVRHRYVFGMNTYNDGASGRNFYGTSEELWL